MSILTKIGSICFDSGDGVDGFISNVFLEVSMVELGRLGIDVSLEGIGGIKDSSFGSSFMWIPFGISTCTSFSSREGRSDTADFTIS